MRSPGTEGTIIIWECETCSEETPHDVELDEVAGWKHLFCQECGNEVVVLPKEGTDETSDLF